MRRFLLVVALAGGCGSVDSNKQVDAKVDDAPGGGSDAPIDTPATCVQAPAMLKTRYRAENNASDHAGNFNGTTVGANFSFAAGKYGSAFQLDGVDDVVTINDGEQLWPAGSFTLEAWIKTTAANANNAIVTKFGFGGTGTGSNHRAYFGLRTDAAGHPIFDFRPDMVTADGITVITATLATVNDGAWHHIVGVRDSAAMTASLYVDGAFATSANPVSGQFGPMTDADGDVDLVTIGANVVASQTTYENLFTGAIDEVAIYHSALTAAQVSAIYNAPQGKCL